MKDQERQPPEAERVQDLEVRGDEAREVAGGKKKQGWRYGKKARAGADAIRGNFKQES